MNENAFYQSVPSFKRFYQVTESSVFHAIPDSWWIVIADIRGSTAAIKEGRYRDVNLVGSACITAVLNAYDRTAIPFVFGGDGATLLLPDEAVQACKTALLATRDFARVNFNLDLRIGIVPVSLIKAKGLTVDVAKYEIAAGNFLAMFQGGGISLAESWVKTKGPDGENFRLETDGSPENVSLKGLSCRWQPLKSSSGKMLSILVVALGANDQQRQTYQEFMMKLEEIVGQESDKMNPINLGAMATESAWNATKKEIKNAYPRRWNYYFSFLIKYLEIAIVRWHIVNEKNIGSFDAKKYKIELAANSDYRKFDDMLRMVIDCSEKQITEIRTYLENQKINGKCYYGLHSSTEALMTCLVFTASQNQHIHFIDGSHGGYAAASVEMKTQKSALKISDS